MGNTRYWKNVTPPGEFNEFVNLANPEVVLKYAGRGRYAIYVKGKPITDDFGLTLTFTDTVAKRRGQEIVKALEVD